MKQRAKKTNSKWCNTNRGGLAFAIKKLILWNEGQNCSNVSREKAGGSVYDWDLVALYYILYPENAEHYLDEYAGYGIVHFRKFIKEQAGFNALLRKWRKAKRPMHKHSLRSLLSLDSEHELASTKDMVSYMNKHREWDEDAMKLLESKVQQKHLPAPHEEDLAQDSDQSQDSLDPPVHTKPLSTPPSTLSLSRKRKASHLLTAIDIPDDKSDYDSVLNSPNAMPLKKRRLWSSSSPSPSPTPSHPSKTTLSPPCFGSPKPEPSFLHAEHPSSC